MARTDSQAGIPGGGTVTSVTGINSVSTTPSPITGVGTVQLVNDALAPGNLKTYLTNETGVRGWKNNTIHLANGAPTVNDDNTQGYYQGASWFDLNTGIYYFCFTAITGAAIWLTYSGGAINVIFDTYANIQALKAGGLLDAQMQYNITDRADVGVQLTAITSDQLSLSGTALFLNADYNLVGDYSGVPGFVSQQGLWTQAGEVGYTNQMVVIWDNLHYEVVDDTAFNGSDPSVNNVAYSPLAKTTTTGYILVADAIEFDFDNDFIQMRKDSYGNRVSCSNAEYTMLGINPLLVFKWGKSSFVENIVDGAVFSCANGDVTEARSNKIQGAATVDLEGSTFAKFAYNEVFGLLNWTTTGANIAECTGNIVRGGFDISATVTNFIRNNEIGIDAHIYYNTCTADLTGNKVRGVSGYMEIAQSSVAVSDNIIEDTSFIKVTNTNNAVINNNHLLEGASITTGDNYVSIEHNELIGGDLIGGTLTDTYNFSNNIVKYSTIDISNNKGDVTYSTLGTNSTLTFTLDVGDSFLGCTIDMEAITSTIPTGTYKHLQADNHMSNFSSTYVITGSNIFDFSTIELYVGKIIFSSTNASETWKTISNLPAPAVGIRFDYYTFKPESGLVINIDPATTTNIYLEAGSGAVAIDGSKEQFIEMTLTTSAGRQYNLVQPSS